MHIEGAHTAGFEAVGRRSERLAALRRRAARLLAPVPHDVARTRLLFAAAVFGGIFVGLPVTFMLIGRLSVTALYATFGAIAGAPVLGGLWREVGPVRALILAVVTAVLAALLMFVLGQGACAASSCTG